MNLDISALAEGILSGKRRALAKGISLVESANTQSAFVLVEKILPYSGNSMRFGITGSPGVGKSSFIESFGQHIRADGKKVAVLAVDPSSEISGGSILGDKVRMTNLARDEGAFIRPSPSRGALGGVGRVTRETILLCEAAGYDTILVETIGVGQSENEVATMTDCVLTLMLPNAGDELQGIKRGSMENADIFVVTKADGIMESAAAESARQIAFSLQFMRWKSPSWKPPVLTASAFENKGIADIWLQCLCFFYDNRKQEIARRRTQQNLRWFSVMTRNLIMDEVYRSEAMRNVFAEAENKIEAGSLLPSRAAAEAARFFFHNALRMQSKM